MSGDPASLRRAIDAVQADVRQKTGVAGRLLTRREQPDTWMEIYEGITDTAAFERELAAAVLRHEVIGGTAQGTRHVEVFVAA